MSFLLYDIKNYMSVIFFFEVVVFWSVITFTYLNLALYFAVKYLFYFQLHLCLDQGIAQMWQTIL